MNEINKFRGEFAWLSNMHMCELIGADDKTYPSAEHYFQSLKTETVEEKERIRNAGTAVVAKQFGRRCQLRKDWLSVRDDMMLTVLRCKFENPDLRKKLIATGDAMLTEGNTWHDTYWGMCNGKGKNMLGELLMQVRKEVVWLETELTGTYEGYTNQDMCDT